MGLCIAWMLFVMLVCKPENIQVRGIWVTTIAAYSFVSLAYMLAIISCNHPFLGRPFEETKSHLIPTIDSSQLFVLYPRFHHGFFHLPCIQRTKQGR